MPYTPLTYIGLCRVVPVLHEEALQLGRGHPVLRNRVCEGLHLDCLKLAVKLPHELGYLILGVVMQAGSVMVAYLILGVVMQAGSVMVAYLILGAQGKLDLAINAACMHWSQRDTAACAPVMQAGMTTL